jgi:2-methylcitrate dehydratase PrpD
LTDGLGETWELAQNTYKPYPGGIVVHPVIDAALELRRKPGITAEAIDRVVVRGHPLLAKRADRPNVTTGREAQVSVQHSVAAALLFGQAGLAQYTDACVRDPAVLALRAKVAVESDTAIDVAAAEIRAWTVDGRPVTVTIPAARGSLTRPLSDREIEEKVRTLAAGWRSGHDVQPLIDAVWALDTNEDAGSLMRLAVPT